MWSDNETSEDLLGFRVHSDLIIELVTNNKLLPLSVGLYGDWGSGKSSIMKMLSESLNKYDEGKVLCIYFNGWQFEGYDDAKVALIETILKEIEQNETVYNKVKDKVIKLGKSIDWLRVGGYVAKNIAIPTISALATNGVSLVPMAISKFSQLLENPQELANQLSTQEGLDKINDLKEILKDSQTENNTPDVVRNFKKQFEELVIKTELESLVIIIDDLDRCSPERIVDNLEAIKLFLNVKNTAFIIGADERIVRHAIEYKYKSNNFTSDEIENFGKIISDYLEKIIQIPYRLPKLSNSDVETYMTLLICKRDLSEEQFTRVLEAYTKFRIDDKHSIFNFEQIQKILTPEDLPKDLYLISRISSLITEVLEGNPRQIKRFLNTFMLRKKLSEVARFNDVKYEILTKLMILEYISPNRFYDLFNWQQKGNGLSKQIAELEGFAISNKIDELKEKYPAWVDLTMWIQLDPLLKDENLADYYWLSRDRLTSSLDGSNLIPNFVRSVFKDIIDYTSINDLNKQIEEKLKNSLTDSEKKYFFSLLKQHTLLNPTDKELYKIFHLTIKCDVSGALQAYIEYIKLADEHKIPATVAFEYIELSQKHNELLSTISNKSDDSAFIKAVKKRIQKEAK